MHFICYSINFHTAPLEIRETVSLDSSRQRDFLEVLRSAEDAVEAMVLCTCNRTELYLNCPKKVKPEAIVEKALSVVKPEAVAIWQSYCDVFEDKVAIEHLFSLAAGLESQMLGENQIVHQLKDAYAQSIEAGTSRFFFHKLMHCAFRASKAVRQGTEISCGAVSLSMAAVETVRAKSRLEGAKVLLIGAGENAALVARYLAKSALCRLTIINRTLDSAMQLAQTIRGAQAAALACLPEYLADADVAIFSTASPHPVLTAEDAGYYLSQRSSPLLIIDLAVPRDVDPAVGSLDHVELINIDQLNEQVEKNRANRSVWIEPAQKIVRQHTMRFIRWQESLDTAAVIAELTGRILGEAGSYAKRNRRYFAKSDQQRLEQFAEGLARKLLHGPIQYLKEADSPRARGDKAQAVELIRKLFLDTKRRRKGQ
ncbi:glutamyl-tRNA reductase [Anaerohalosphaeraceae bacterium U12dextr]